MTAQTTLNVSRRGLLAGLGGLSFCIGLGADGAVLFPSAEAAGPVQMNAWVRIAPDGIVTIYSPGAEMGQGSGTSLPLIVAEEMDADWSKVRVEFAPSDVDIYGYGDAGRKSMAIVGSRAVMSYFNDLRIAGAQVRKILIANAAARWGVDAATLRTEPGAVVDPAGGRRLTYGEIASFGSIPAQVPPVDKSELKKRADFRLIGKTMPRVDIPEKVNGSAIYAIDVHLPGMVYASSRHSPVHGGKPQTWNDAAVKAMPGVVATVKLPNGVAVVAERWEQALAARDKLEVIWAKGSAEGFHSEKALEDEYVAIHDDPNFKAETLHAQGDVKAAFENAAKVYRAEYRSDLGYHAQMEPLNAVARLTPNGDAIEVWDGTQAPDRAREDVAKALGMDVKQVTVHQCYMGGAFGRRSIGDYTAEAALIAKEAKRPVKLIWTREEDLGHGMFRPQSFQCLEAALDSTGKVVGWKHCVVGDGGGLLTTGIKIPFYQVANQHLERRGVSHGVRLKHWRAVGHVFNMFAAESLIDEMARDQNVDPLEFRLTRMSADPRARKVLEKVAQMSDWSAKRPIDRAVGLSLSERSRSVGAAVAEISVERDTGKIRVHKVWLAADGGLIVQPDAAKANVESAIIYGLSSVLVERVTVRDGAVEQTNFHDYNVLRMSDAPEEIHVEFVDSDGAPSGLGEIGNPPIAAAVANAFVQLTGKRLRHMPFTAERVSELLKA